MDSTKSKARSRFLAHRVQEPTIKDRAKLGRLLTYAKYTKDKCLHLRPISMQLEVYIDASHAIHTYRRGHTGVVLMMGGSIINARSMRQKNTKISTEMEVIAARIKPRKRFRIFQRHCTSQ